MNHAQLTKYWPEWKKAKARLLAQGHSEADCEAMRKRIHIKRGAFYCVSGVFKVKSSSRLTNREFDGVLADFLAITHGDDLAAQLEQLGMPEKRILYATAQLLDRIQIAEDGRAKYLEGVARKPLADCDDRDEQRIIIALTHTAMHREGKAHSHPRSGKGRERHDHRVGSRSHKSDPNPSQTLNRNRSNESILQESYL